MPGSLTSKRVALISRSLSDLGGLEKYGRRLSHYFRQMGADITLVSEHLPATKSAGFHYQALPLTGRRHHKIMAFANQAAQFIEQKPFDIILGMDRIHHQTHLRAGNGIHAAYLHHKRVARTPFLGLKTWLNPVNKTLLTLEKQALTSPHLKRVITNSNMVKEEVRTFYPQCQVPITAIHNGVEWEEMAAPFANWEKGKKAFCEKHGLSPNTFFFLFIGHGFERKGLHFLLKALRHLQHEPIALLVVGGDKRASYFKRCANKWGLSHLVHFFGANTETLPFFQTADAMVIPSIYDPFANVTVEALAMGLFVVSSPYNGGKEVLTPERGCVIEKLTDSEAFATALKEALKHKKTAASAKRIRESVAHLDFKHQLATFTKTILEDV